MPHHLIRKLEHFTKLSEANKLALIDLAGPHRRSFEARENIVCEGDDTKHVNLLIDGWAYRYKMLEGGRRQIISFFLPGDLCDEHVFVLREMDHSVAALTPVSIVQIPREAMLAVTEGHPRVTHALCWEMLVAAAIQREWTVNLGQRTASERLGHLFCELFIRLRTVGLTQGQDCTLPVTQMELADAMGLSNVHVNRTLQELRGAGLISLKGKRLTIPNLEALMRASLFDPSYLHLDREGAHLDAN